MSLPDGLICLDYTQLTVNTRLNITNAEFSIPLSAINKILSEDCIAGYDWECYFVPDPSNGEASLTIDGNCTSGLPDLVIDIDNGEGRLFLFTVVVDAWPDEDISLVCNGLLYATDESLTLPDLGVDGLYTCSDETTEDSGSGNTMPCTASDEIAIASTSLSESFDYSILLNEVDLSSAPDYHDCLVQLKANENIAADHFLDFTLLVTTTEDMIDPVLVEDNQDLDVEWERFMFVNGSGQKVYLFYVRLAVTGAIADDTYDLFRVRIYPPVFISAGGDACIEFGKGRVRSGNTSCDLLEHDNNFEDNNRDCTTFGDSPDECTNDFAVQVKGLEPATCDGTLQVEVTFDFIGGSYIDVDAFRLRLDFEGDDIEVTGASLGSAVPACVAGNPAICDSGYSSDCFQYDGNSFSMCFQEGINGSLRIYSGQPITIDLTTGSGCIDAVVFREVELSLDGGTFETCIPDLTKLTTEYIPLCIPVVAGEVKDELGAFVEDAKVHIENTPAPITCEEDPIHGCSGYASCVCGYDDYVITPTHNQNHLNGVSSFDLVLIQKHILGIEYFSTLDKRISADADWNSIITSNDITNIRRVILGLSPIFDNDMTPHDASWRFYPATTTLTLNDPSDYSEVPGFIEFITVTVSSLGNNPSNLNFKAVKIGDVNSSHIANACRPEGRPAAEQAAVGEYPVAFSTLAARPGEYITMPLINEGKESLEGLQAAFRFDPAAFEFVGASLGEVEGISPGCFGLQEVGQGLIRMVWLSPDMDEMRWKPGQVLCYFTFRAKSSMNEHTTLLSLDHEALAGQTYVPGNRIYDLALLSVTPVTQRVQAPGKASFAVQCLPNPTAGDAILRVETPEAADRMKIAVFSAFGQRLFFRQMDLPEGRSDIAIPEATQWTPGVYTWRVWNKAERREGKLIKQ